MNSLITDFQGSKGKNGLGSSVEFDSLAGVKHLSVYLNYLQF